MINVVIQQINLLFSENVTQFEQALKSQEFFHTNIIFDRMIVKSPKLSEELLNQKISTNHFENDCESSETHLALDFGLFHTKNESTAESLPNLRMLDEGLNDFSCRVFTLNYIKLP